MEDNKTNPVLRFFPSMTDFAFLMPVIFIFAGMHGAKTLLGDCDTGWHVRTGEWIMSHGRVPHEDMFSYTKNGQTWFAWEWLWDVIFAWLHQHWGMAAVVVGSALLISLTSALLFRLAHHKSGSPLVAMSLTFLAIASSSIHFLARPHLVTLLFTVVFYTILERSRENRSNRILWVLAGAYGSMDQSARRMVYGRGAGGDLCRRRDDQRILRRRTWRADDGYPARDALRSE